MAANMTTFLVAHLEAHGLQPTGADGPGENFKAMCFNGHDVRSPSLSIRKSDGAFLCFGCGVRGRNWEVLIRALGGEDISQEDLPDPFGILNAQVVGTGKQTTPQALPRGLEPWQHGRYRGLSEGFLKRVEAYRWYDDGTRCYRILFPIRQRNQSLGWVARRLDQNDFMKYRNAKNMQTGRVLYPYDFCDQYFNCRTVCLVEGPMDALRLCHFRIPTLAILGTSNWRERKRSLLLSLGVRRVIICTDSDPAGHKCRYDTLEPTLKDWFDVEHFFAPDGEDPGAMDRKHCLQLKEIAVGK